MALLNNNLIVHYDMFLTNYTNVSWTKETEM
jgi:hypothetical protein